MGAAKLKPRRSIVGAAVELAGGVAEVARKVGVAEVTVQKWIREDKRNPGYLGQCEYRNVIALAMVTGVSPDRLTGTVIPPEYLTLWYGQTANNR